MASYTLAKVDIRVVAWANDQVVAHKITKPQSEKIVAGSLQ